MAPYLVRLMDMFSIIETNLVIDPSSRASSVITRTRRIISDGD